MSHSRAELQAKLREVQDYLKLKGWERNGSPVGWRKDLEGGQINCFDTVEAYESQKRFEATGNYKP